LQQNSNSDTDLPRWHCAGRRRRAAGGLAVGCEDIEWWRVPL